MPGVLRAYRQLRPDGPVSVGDWIERAARNHPDRAFLLWGETGMPRQLSYAEFNARANRVAWWAMHRGLRTGDVVALLMENRPEYPVTWAGLAKAGVTSALLNTHLGGDALCHAFRASGARVLIAGTECLDRLATASGLWDEAPELWLSHEEAGAAVPAAVPAEAHDLDADLEERSRANPDPSVRDELHTGDPLFYIYTSGTTGLPKAARFSHLRFLFAGVGAGAALLLEPGDVYYCALPLYHSAGGVMAVSSALANGATLALRRRFSARAFWDDCRRFEATHFQYIGEFCRYLLNQPPRDDDTEHPVRTAIGNGLRPDIWQEFQQRFALPRIVEFYGATEGIGMFANLTGKPGAVGSIPLGWLGRRIGLARLIRFDVERDEPVRDANGFCVECKPDEPGELISRISEKSALGRFEGYTNQQASSKKIMRDVFAPGDAWYRTGDLLKRDRGHWLYFVDRIGDTFRWKGENVSTQEVAEMLAAWPGVEICNVYGAQIENMDGRAGMVALVLEAGVGSFDPKGFYEFVDERLPSYAVPVFVRLIAEAEMTATLKLRKVTLQQQGFDTGKITDPLFFRDEKAGTYAPLTPEIHQNLLSGTVRL